MLGTISLMVETFVNFSATAAKGRQQVTTAGNAILVAYDNRPILCTDPWIGDEEPAYFGSWVLSHAIPSELKQEIYKSEYIWFSHGHPDHLNPTSLERFRGRKILLPDHVNSRILRDVSALGYQVSVLPDRTWVGLSPNIRIQCITTKIQDAILLLDVCGKLFINLNDAGVRDCARYVRSVSAGYAHSYVMGLSGYGDADMINLYRDDGSFITPRAASKPAPGLKLTEYAKATGAKAVIPFSTFHQYQRTDSIWAQSFTTPVAAFTEGLASNLQYIPAFSSVDCNDLAVETRQPPELQVTARSPEEFGDNWSDVLEQDDQKLLADYFSRKERIQKYFGFINFNVGGRDFTLRLRGKRSRGISFAVPRTSLMSAIKYRIFDDLLIGNFMKTTLYGVTSLYEGKGNFNFHATKFGDNGLAETEEELGRYLAEYRHRAGTEYLLGILEDKSRDFVVRFAGKNSRVYGALKSAYFQFR
jgi:hypothetical protein